MAIYLLSTCGVYVSSKMLENKTLRSQGKAQVQKHSLNAQGSEHQWLESQEKKRKMSLMKSSN